MSEPTRDSSVPGAPAADAPAVPAVPGSAAPEQLRAMYEMLFERNPDGIAYCDSQGVMVINPAGLALLGVNEQPDAKGPEKWQQVYGLFLEDGKTPHPPETLPLARALVNRETVHDCPLHTKSPTYPEGRLLSVTATPLPNGDALAVFRDITDRRRMEQELAQRNAELAEQMRENLSLIERLRLAVDELSTPVLELADDILALPVVGIVDTVRSARMMEKILAEVVSRRSRAVIIDVTGVDVIDTSTADRFIRIARSIELLGAECVICGVQPAVSQTLTDLGVSFQGLSMQRNLKRALDLCIARQQSNRRSYSH